MNEDVKVLEKALQDIRNERIELQIKEKTITDALLILRERQEKAKVKA